jgi:hypothetical protein
LTLIISLGALALLGIVSYLIYKKRYRGLSVALAMCVLSILVGLWAIFQSRSSTAGIGILLLPFYGLFSAIMGWLFSNLREREIQLVRVIGWGCMAISLAVPLGLAYQGFQSITLNQSRDAQHKESLASIQRNKAFISEILEKNPGRETETIEGLVAAHAADRNFLLPLLENKFISPEILDRLSNNNDLGITLSALRNPRCKPETLTRIYRTHTYPDYFFQTLAAHENTPPEILTELYRRPVTINGLDRSFARNPSTPPEILAEIASTTKESFVIQQLLQNPKLECALLSSIEASLKKSERPHDDYSAREIQSLIEGRCNRKKQEQAP